MVLRRALQKPAFQPAHNNSAYSFLPRLAVVLDCTLLHGASEDHRRSSYVVPCKSSHSNLHITIMFTPLVPRLAVVLECTLLHGKSEDHRRWFYDVPCKSPHSSLHITMVFTPLLPRLAVVLECTLLHGTSEDHRRWSYDVPCKNSHSCTTCCFHSTRVSCIVISRLEYWLLQGTW